MAKYNDKLKIKIVLEYINRNLSYRALAKKHDIPSGSTNIRWVRAYKEFGETGIQRKLTKQVYSVQFKLNVFHFMKRTGAPYQDTAIEFNMNNPSLIMSWNSQFLKDGIEGLKEKMKGRPPMSKNHKAKPIKQNKEFSREEQLERENELLRL